MKGDMFFFGGAFDPLTKFHEHIIMKLSKQLSEDDVLIVGVSSVENYKNYMFSIDMRMKMADAFLHTLDKKNVVAIEQNRRTYDFLKNLRLSKDYSKTFIIIGNDEWRDLHDMRGWAYSEELLNEYMFIVMPRGDEPSSTIARDLLVKNPQDMMLPKILSENTLNECRMFIENRKRV